MFFHNKRDTCLCEVVKSRQLRLHSNVKHILLFKFLDLFIQVVESKDKYLVVFGYNKQEYIQKNPNVQNHLNHPT